MKPHPLLLTVTAFLGLAGLSACADRPTTGGAPQITESRRSLERREITAGQFRLALYSRIRDTNQPATVYIDGDVREFEPTDDSGNGTATDEHLALRLAERDPSANVVFISRPCHSNINDPACDGNEWRHGRVAQLILNSARRALTYAISVVPHPHLHLVGYSGGAILAAQLASERRDVLSLRTIAGNIDPQTNGQIHGTVPQSDFIDPMGVAFKLSKIPQEHFVGDQDTAVPPRLADNFSQAVGSAACVKITHVANATHTTGWEAFWSANATRFPVCLDATYTNDRIN